MPFQYINGMPVWVDGENTYQRTKKHYQGQPQQQQQEKPTKVNELERMFADAEAQGVTKDEILELIKGLKPGEGAEKLQELKPKTEEVDQSQLKAQYQAEYNAIPAYVNGEERANTLNALRQKYRAKGLKGQL